MTPVANRESHRQAPIARLSIVTGAPGSGKTTALGELLELGTPFLAFDMDWLLESASALAGRDVHFARSTWPAYGALWLEVLHGVVRNGHDPVLFAPLSPADLPAERPPWCHAVSWLLLDCSDDLRNHRLRARGWPVERTAEAIRDAADLRSQIPSVVRTDDDSVRATASAIVAWLRSSIRETTCR